MCRTPPLSASAVYHVMSSKASRRGNFKNIYSWEYGLLDNRLFLRNFEKALLENLIRSYGSSFSWKILCVLLNVRTKIFWKFWCVLVHFACPGKFICVLVSFLVPLENLACYYKTIICLILENLRCSCYIQAAS